MINLIDRSGIKGKFEIYINGELADAVDNLIMDATILAMIRTLKGTAADIQIKYLALGTGTTAPANTNTQLQTEIFRTAILSQSEPITGEVNSLFQVLSTEAVATIEEIGIFGGAAAGGTANSGTLLARVLWHHVKTNTEEIQFRRIEILGRA